MRIATLAITAVCQSVCLSVCNILWNRMRWNILTIEIYLYRDCIGFTLENRNRHMIYLSVMECVLLRNQPFMTCIQHYLNIIVYIYYVYKIYVKISYGHWWVVRREERRLLIIHSFISSLYLDYSSRVAESAGVVSCDINCNPSLWVLRWRERQDWWRQCKTLVWWKPTSVSHIAKHDKLSTITTTVL